VNEMTALDLAALTQRSILTGVSGGDRCFDAVKGPLAGHRNGEPVILDFAGVEALGGSALRRLLQGVQGLKSCEGSAVVLANLSEDALAEADLVAETMRAPYIAAALTENELVLPTVRGQLDDKVAKTLILVLQAGEADAQAICNLANESGVVTAWNNRLVALHSLGLLREHKVGKRKFYSPVIGGLAYGG
jgi:hypothetical protein